MALDASSDAPVEAGVSANAECLDEYKVDAVSKPIDADEQQDKPSAPIELKVEPPNVSTNPIGLSEAGVEVKVDVVDAINEAESFGQQEKLSAPIELKVDAPIMSFDVGVSEVDVEVKVEGVEAIEETGTFLSAPIELKVEPPNMSTDPIGLSEAGVKVKVDVVDAIDEAESVGQQDKLSAPIELKVDAPIMSFDSVGVSEVAVEVKVEGVEAIEETGTFEEGETVNDADKVNKAEMADEVDAIEVVVEIEEAEKVKAVEKIEAVEEVHAGEEIEAGAEVEPVEYLEAEDHNGGQVEIGDGDEVEDFEGREPDDAARDGVGGDFQVLAANLRLERQNARQLQTERRDSSFRRYWQLSYLLLGLLVYHAFSTRKQFYPAAVYLSTSKVALIAAGNALIVTVMLCFHGIVGMFMGQLRESERDQMGEQLRYALTESCIALTMFREEITVQMAFFFLVMIATKCLHWAVELRSTHIQQTDASISKKHTGMLLLSMVLLSFDLVAIALCAKICDEHGPSYHILFGFEAAILVLSAISTVAGYTIFAVDSRQEGIWHAKGMCTFTLEFGMEAVRFLFYVIFFAIVFMYYGMPLNLFRDVWMSYTSLRKKLTAFCRYRSLTANMNERFPDATPEQLANAGSCIICRDTLQAGKVLPCGHIFHFYCLRQWLQQQQSCPTCRTEIPTEMPPRAAPAPADQERAGNIVAEAAEQRPVDGERDANAQGGEARERQDEGAGEVQRADTTVGVLRADTTATATVGAPQGDETSGVPHVDTQLDVPHANATASIPAAANSDLPVSSSAAVPTTVTSPTFQEVLPSRSDQSFPCMCQVKVDAAPVFGSSGSTMPVLREVQGGVAVVCTGKALGVDGEVMLSIPDGWIRESDVSHLDINMPLCGLMTSNISNFSPILSELRLLHKEVKELKYLVMEKRRVQNSDE